jgi:hypothetical protein
MQMIEIPVFVFVTLLIVFVLAVVGLIFLAVLDNKHTNEVNKLTIDIANLKASKQAKADAISNYSEAMRNIRWLAPNFFTLFSKTETEYTGTGFGYSYPVTRTTWDFAKLTRLAAKQSEVNKADRATIELLDEGSF